MMKGHCVAWVMMMDTRVNLENQSAVVLHHYPYKNNSLLIYFFLPSQGKVSAIARGIKQSKKNEMSSVQPFQELKVSLQGKGDLLYYKNVDHIARVWSLKGRALYCGYYLNELLLRLLPVRSDCHDIFTLYTKSLELLLQPEPGVSEQANDGSNVIFDNQFALEIPLRYFELKLLQLLGYGLNLMTDIDTGEPVVADKLYTFDIHAGPSLMSYPGTVAVPVSGNTLINLDRLQFNDRQTLKESKQLLKCALSAHLGNKPLKSREIFRKLYC